jgi:hypothetical protein
MPTDAERMAAIKAVHQRDHPELYNANGELLSDLEELDALTALGERGAPSGDFTARWDAAAQADNPDWVSPDEPFEPSTEHEARQALARGPVSRGDLMNQLRLARIDRRRHTMEQVRRGITAGGDSLSGTPVGVAVARQRGGADNSAELQAGYMEQLGELETERAKLRAGMLTTGDDRQAQIADLAMTMLANKMIQEGHSSRSAMADAQLSYGATMAVAGRYWDLDAGVQDALLEAGILGGGGATSGDPRLVEAFDAWFAANEDDPTSDKAGAQLRAAFPANDERGRATMLGWAKSLPGVEEAIGREEAARAQGERGTDGRSRVTSGWGQVVLSTQSDRRHLGSLLGEPPRGDDGEVLLDENGEPLPPNTGTLMLQPESRRAADAALTKLQEISTFGRSDDIGTSTAAYLEQAAELFDAGEGRARLEEEIANFGKPLQAQLEGKIAALDRPTTVRGQRDSLRESDALLPLMESIALEQGVSVNEIDRGVALNKAEKMERIESRAARQRTRRGSRDLMGDAASTTRRQLLSGPGNYPTAPEAPAPAGTGNEGVGSTEASAVPSGADAPEEEAQRGAVGGAARALASSGDEAEAVDEGASNAVEGPEQAPMYAAGTASAQRQAIDAYTQAAAASARGGSGAAGESTNPPEGMADVVQKEIEARTQAAYADANSAAESPPRATSAHRFSDWLSSGQVLTDAGELVQRASARGPSGHAGMPRDRGASVHDAGLPGPGATQRAEAADPTGAVTARMEALAIRRQVERQRNAKALVVDPYDPYSDQPLE